MSQRKKEEKFLQAGLAGVFTSNEVETCAPKMEKEDLEQALSLVINVIEREFIRKMWEGDSVLLEDMLKSKKAVAATDKEWDAQEKSCVKQREGFMNIYTGIEEDLRDSYGFNEDKLSSLAGNFVARGIVLKRRRLIEKQKEGNQGELELYNCDEGCIPCKD
jgi:hypothetical protein